MSTHPNPYLSPRAGTPEPPVLAQLVGGEGLSLDYEVVPQDLIQFMLFHHKNSPTTRSQLFRAMVYMSIAFFIAVLLMAWWAERQPAMWWGVAALAIFGMIRVALMPANHRRKLRSAIERMSREGRNLTLFGPRRVSMSPAFLSYASPYTQSLMRWVAVERVVSSPEAIYIYVSAASAHILPRRSFASDEDFRTFARMAADYNSRALASELPPPLATMPGPKSP
jgi:hypothetical protein